MAFAGNNRRGRQAPVAFLDDARKLRSDRKRPHPGDEHALESSGEDCSGYALGLADSLLSTDADPTRASSPDEILARHERGSENASSAPRMEQPQPAAAADEILLALEAHHQRAEPGERRPAPRGTADLDVHPPQRPRPKASGTRARRKSFFARRRVIGAGGIATIVVGVAIAISANPSTTSSKIADHFASASQNALGLPLGTIAIPNLSVIAADHHHAEVNHRVRRRPRLSVKHAAPVHSPSASGTSARPPSSTSAPRSTSDVTTSPPAPTYSPQLTSSSLRSAASTSQNSASSRAQPAGPAGPGYVIGSNCNPKCR